MNGKRADDNENDEKKWKFHSALLPLLLIFVLMLEKNVLHNFRYLLKFCWNSLWSDFIFMLMSEKLNRLKLIKLFDEFFECFVLFEFVDVL